MSQFLKKPVLNTVLVAGVASSIMLAGCGTSTSNNTTGSTTTPANNTQQAASTEPTKFNVSSLTGAGSTFDYPFFSQAFSQFGQTHGGIQVNYQSVGSGAGITQFTKQLVDFGATDVPMSDKELAAAKQTGGDVVQIPVTLGAAAMAYNVPEAQGQIKLTADDIAGIYLGTIKKWNDAAIVKDNPDAKLPDKAITVVHRSDGSGTSYIFTDYLSHISSDWKSKVGAGKSVNWPVGVGAKGNEAVAGQIKNTPYSIGYVELAYALQTNMTFATVKNHDGSFVAPSLDSASAAAAAFPNVSATNFSIVDATGAQSYPISGYSWALLYKNQKDADKGSATVNLFNWLITKGQDQAKAVNYAPLPANIQKLAQDSLKTIVGPDNNPILK